MNKYKADKKKYAIQNNKCLQCYKRERHNETNNCRRCNTMRRLLQARKHDQWKMLHPYGDDEFFEDDSNEEVPSPMVKETPTEKKLHTYCEVCERKICLGSMFSTTHFMHRGGTELKSGFYCMPCSEAKTIKARGTTQEKETW